jgi:hypothetical protein
VVALVTLSHVTHELAHYFTARYLNVPAGRILIGRPSKWAMKLTLWGIRFVVTPSFLVGGHVRMNLEGLPSGVVYMINLAGPIADLVFALICLMLSFVVAEAAIKGLFLMLVVLTLLATAENAIFGTDFRYVK